jgi:transposase
LRQAPEVFGIERARWRLADLASVVPALASYSEGGISLALRRLGISLQRGRAAAHSPDPAYRQKLALVGMAMEEARSGSEATLLFGDEMSFYRQPTLAPRYAVRGEEPVARWAASFNSRQRIAGAINAVTGQVTYLASDMIGATTLGRFFKRLRKRYPAGRIVLVWDNWPVHLHVGVLADASALGIEILWLPTYAPWTNPIEKLWRWCKQELLHHHRLSGDWKELKARVRAWLDRFGGPSPELLRYIGLLPN